MTTDHGPVVQSALLRAELVRLRKERAVTQEEVARALEWHPSKLIRIEGGKSGITKTDLQVLLMQYGMTSESRQERLNALARGARQPSWWSAYRGDFDEAYLTFIGYEAGASVIRHFQNSTVPATLQTQEYAEVLTTNFVETVEVGPVVKLRMQRQKELEKRDEPPRRYYVLDEAVIRRHVGVRTDPAIMPAQLQQIADTAEQDELVTVRVIPFSVGAHTGLNGPFTLLEFEGGLGDVIYLEGTRSRQTQNLFTSEESMIAEHRAAFESLLDEALSAEESIALIRRTAEELMN